MGVPKIGGPHIYMTPVPEDFKLQCWLLVLEGIMLGCWLGNSPLNSMLLIAAVDTQETRGGASC